MNTKTNKLIGELAARCVAMNCDTLHVFFNYCGHVNGLTIRHHLGGWSEGPAVETYTRYLSLDESDITHLNHAHAELDKLQQEHDKLYAPENLAATQEAARLARIAELQKQIEELSNPNEALVKQAKGRSIRNSDGEQ